MPCATAVGRTSDVTGHLTIAGSTVTAAAFSVPMDTVHSDKSQRDAQFDGRIMDVSRYPTGTFTLTAERKGRQIEVSGDIAVLFSDYGIANPSFAGFVTTQDHGLLEFLLVFNMT